MIRSAPIEGSSLVVAASDSCGDFEAMWPTMANRGSARAFVFQTADFLNVWCDTIGQARGTQPLFVAVVDEHGVPHALFPLGIEKRKSGLKVLSFLDGGVSDYNAPVLFPPAKDWSPSFVGKLWDAIARIAPPFDIAVVEKMPDRVFDIDNPLMPLITAPYPHSGHVMRLPVSVDEFVSKRLPRAQDTRRKLRKLGERGTVAFRIASTSAERDEMLEAMMRQKSRRYIETTGIDGMERPGYRAFFRKAALDLAPRGLVHLSALSLGGTFLAVHWGYKDDSRFYYMMPSFEEGEWVRFSPGRHLLNYLIEWAIDAGMKEFDQGLGNEDYKKEYCDAAIALHQIETPRTVRGQADLFVRRLKMSLRDTLVWNSLKSLRTAWRKRKFREGKDRAARPGTVAT